MPVGINIFNAVGESVIDSEPNFKSIGFDYAQDKADAVAYTFMGSTATMAVNPSSNTKIAPVLVVSEKSYYDFKLGLFKDGLVPAEGPHFNFHGVTVHGSPVVPDGAAYVIGSIPKSLLKKLDKMMGGLTTIPDTASALSIGKFSLGLEKEPKPTLAGHSLPTHVYNTARFDCPDIKQRAGYVALPYEFIEQGHTTTDRLFEMMALTGAACSDGIEKNFANQTYVFFGYSPSFDALGPNEVTPEYDFVAKHIAGLIIYRLERTHGPGADWVGK